VKYNFYTDICEGTCDESKNWVENTDGTMCVCGHGSDYDVFDKECVCSKEKNGFNDDCSCDSN